MSRSGYTDEEDFPGQFALWRGRVASAIRGKRGQALLRDLLAALDAMPVKALAAESLVTADGEFCTLGVLGAQRGIDLAKLDPDDPDQVAEVFGIATCMAQEIVYQNDEAVDEDKLVKVEICGPMRGRQYSPYRGWLDEEHERWVRMPLAGIPEKRWQYMRDWVAKNLKDAA